MTFTRRQFLKTSALTAGAVWTFGGNIALSQIPWEDEKESTLIEDDDLLSIEDRQTLGRTSRVDTPRMAMDGDRVLLLWFLADFQSESMFFSTYENGEFSEQITIVENEGILHPSIAHSQNLGTIVVWTQRNGDSWNIMHAFPEGDNTPQPIANSNMIKWHPKVAVNDDSALVVWEEKSGDHYRVVGRKFNGSWSDEFVIAEDQNQDCRRPDVIMNESGEAFVSWDQSNGRGGSTIFLRPLSSSNALGDVVQITDHPAFNHASALSYHEGGVLVAWHTNRKGKSEWDIPRWIQVRLYRDGELYDPKSEMQDKNLAKEGTDQSFEFAQLIPMPYGGVVVTGRPSHNFCFQALGDKGWSPLYRVPVDSWGGRGQFMTGAFDSAGDLWVVRRDFGENVLNKITGLSEYDGKPEFDRVTTPLRPHSDLELTNIDKAPDRWPALEDLEGIDEPLLAFYGDIHGHTWNSDGVGDVDEYYRTRKEYYEDDFGSLTDHDLFVRNVILPSEFEYQKELTDHYNDDTFVTFFGQEYTTARLPIGVGHKCIYDIKKDIPLYDHSNPEFDSTPKINAVLKERDAIWIPHHTGWLGTDWDECDDEVQPLVEIVSCHGRFEFEGNLPIQHRGGMRGSFVQDALAKGHKIGIIGGSDSHGLIWHHRMSRKRDCNRTGLAVVLAPELTREALFDAMKKRRVYGTTGTKPMLDFRVNNHLMGEEITVDEPKVKISAEVMSREDIVYLTVVKDNKDWYHYGGGDFVARFSMDDEELTPGTHWYYLRVLFDNEEMAWSSPIWVNYSG